MTIFTLITMLATVTGISCKKTTMPMMERQIEYLHNEHLHFHSIPRPCKRVEINANGSVALRNVSVIKPDGGKQALEGDLATFSFVPDTPGNYKLQYQYTYTNHFEHLVPQNPDLATWNTGDYTFEAQNYPIPDGYQSVTSVNRYITVHFPSIADSSIIKAVIEIKPAKTTSILAIEIIDYAKFPEAYTISGKETVRILFPLEVKNFKAGIKFYLFSKENMNETIDSIELKKDLNLKPLDIVSLTLKGERPSQYIDQSLYFLEDGNLKLWNFIENIVSIITNDQSYRFFALSPNRKQIALSTLNDTYLCDYNGMDIHKIASGYNKPIFINDNLILLVGAYQWSEGEASTYGSITLQNNVYRMPLGVYNLTNKVISPEIQTNVYLGERWSMYFPTIADIPVDIVPFEKAPGEYLFKIISPGLEPKWIIVKGTQVSDYTREYTPWIATKPYIFQEFSFQGDIQQAILKNVTYNNQYDVLYVDSGYASLSFPEEKSQFVTFLRTVQDLLSAPSFYIERLNELCVYDKLSKKTYTLPVNSLSASHLGLQ